MKIPTGAVILKIGFSEWVAKNATCAARVVDLLGEMVLIDEVPIETKDALVERGLIKDSIRVYVEGPECTWRHTVEIESLRGKLVLTQNELSVLKSTPRPVRQLPLAT